MNKEKLTSMYWALCSVLKSHPNNGQTAPISDLILYLHIYFNTFSFHGIFNIDNNSHLIALLLSR